VNQQDTDRMLAWAQILFAFMMLFGIFSLVFVLIFFNTNMTATAVTIMTSVITALVTILTLQMNFFYARQRPAALPDPTTTSTTSTTTTTPTPLIVPAGTTVVHAPQPPTAIIHDTSAPTPAASGPLDRQGTQP